MKGELFNNFTEDGAWCFFADPRVVYYEGAHQRTYAGWLTKNGDVMVGAYDHQMGSISTVMIKESLQKDDHANPSLYFIEDGRAIVYYSAHNGTQMLYRIMTDPEDIHSFGEEQELTCNTGGKHGYTYPNPIYLAEEDNLYLFWRGGNFKPNFSVSSDKGQTWADVQTLVMGEGARPYIKFAAHDGDTFWFAFTDGHPNIEPHNSIYCAYYRNGNIYHANGELIKSLGDLPLVPAEVERVFDGKEHDRNAWIWDISVDSEGLPTIAYTVFASEQDHRYYYSYWDGQIWLTNEIVAGGAWFPQTPAGVIERETYYSGGIILDHNDPTRVFLSRPVNGIFEIEQWTTADHGKSWSSTAITSDSQHNNVRPVLSRGTDGRPPMLIWMNGNYIHFTNYDTSLKMKLL